MNKKRQNIPKSITKAQSGKDNLPSEKASDDAWERLLKIRDEIRKAADSSEQPADNTMERFANIGEELGKNWQSKKSAVEILSEMRR